MDIAQIVDIGDINARSIAAPLFQFGFDMPGFIREMFCYPVQEINSIGIIIAGNKLAIFTCFEPFITSFKHQIHSIPRHFKMSVIFAVFITAAAIIQMR